MVVLERLRAAVEEEEHGVCAITAADQEPLIDASELDRLQRSDRVATLNLGRASRH